MESGRRHIAGGIARAVAACGLGLVVATVASGEGAADPQVATGTSATAPGGPLPYWQAPALPTAVIQGGTIPPGWQPQAVPYQGIGPDGRPLTVYFAPTYVFTYQSGPPVLAVPPVSRGVPGVAPGPSYGAYGWNYQAQGAPAAPVTLPPATVARYQPAPYQFPPDARALTGTPIAPPATPLPVPPPAVMQQQQQPMPQPLPAQQGFVPAAAPPPPIAPPPTQWVPVPGSPAR